jgi:hypothetical protein
MTIMVVRIQVQKAASMTAVSMCVDLNYFVRLETTDCVLDY